MNAFIGTTKTIFVTQRGNGVMNDFCKEIQQPGGVKNLMKNYAIFMEDPGVIRGNIVNKKGAFKKVETARFRIIKEDWETTGAKGTLKIEYVEPEALKLGGISEDDTFEAYWVSYQDGKTYRTVLESKCSFMLTSNMSGCTFARGITSADQSVIVGHANVKDLESNPEEKDGAHNRQKKYDMQLENLINKFAKKNYRLNFHLNPTSYRDIDYGKEYPKAGGTFQPGAVVIGCLEDNSWNFWCQFRAQLPGRKAIWYSVTEI